MNVRRVNSLMAVIMVASVAAGCSAAYLSAGGNALFALGAAVAPALAAGTIEPSILVVAALASSAATGGLSSLSLPFVQISLGGVVTGVLACTSALSLAVHRKRVTRSLLRSFAPFLLFVGWSLVRAVGTPAPIDAIKDVGLFAAPVLIGLAAGVAAKRKASLRRSLGSLVWGVSAVPVLGVLGGIGLGFVQLTPLGLRGPFGTRTLALFLLVVLCVSLSWSRFERRCPVKSAWLVWTGLTVGVLVATLSRTALVTSVALASVALVQPRRLSQWVLAAVLVALLVLALLQVPEFRARFFFADGGELVDLLNPEKVNTMGRAYLWPIVLRSALESPLIGNGTGSARALVSSVSSLDHPHNDYLRVLHDLGIVGLGLLLLGWGGRVRHHWLSWLSTGRRDIRVARLHMAACLSGIGLTVSFVTDNTLVYTFVTTPVFVLFAVADSWSQGGSDR